MLLQMAQSLVDIGDEDWTPTGTGQEVFLVDHSELMLRLQSSPSALHSC